MKSSSGSAAQSGPSSLVDNPKVLVVGLGSIGRRHLACLKSLGVEGLRAFRPVGRTPVDPELLSGVTVYESFEDALSDGPDAVIVANPTTHHLATASAALSAGCHVLVEKPISHTPQGVADLGGEAERRGLVLSVAYQMRFHPGVRLLRQLVNDGRIGAPLSVRAEVGQYLPDWHPEEDYRTGVSARVDTGGGVLLDLSHELDYLTAIFGRARNVTGFVGQVSSLEIETEDVAELVMECEGVRVASVHVDYLQRVLTRRCHVVGEAGSLECDLVDATVSLLGPNGTEERWQEPSFVRHDMYVAQMEHFLGCVAGLEDPEVGMAQALHCLEIIEGAREAARTGRRQELSDTPTKEGKPGE